MSTEKTWWASYDPETFKYTGMRLSIEQPENATSIGIGDLINPVWNPALNQWEGESSAEQLAKLQAKSQSEAVGDESNAPLANLASVVADLQDTVNTSVSSLMVQVAQLHAKLESDTSTPTNVSVDATTGNSATVTTEQEK